jgi:hypothetical protein
MDAMTGSGFDSLVGGFAFLLLGVAELVVLQRFVFPVLRWRHEEAKVTGRQGRDPAYMINALRFQSLALMPVLGFLLGGRFKAIFG